MATAARLADSAGWSPVPLSLYLATLAAVIVTIGAYLGAWVSINCAF